MAKASSTPLALARIDKEEKVLDVRVRFRGKAAQDVADYQRAYAAANGEPVDAEALVLNIVTAFIEADRGFQAWRKANPTPEGRA